MNVTLYLFLFLPIFSIGQRIDTLTIESKVFNEKRDVYVHLPENYQYVSDSVNLPVIFVLDGQHDWFINPILSDIEYLQYTHEIPNAIIVLIPLKNRYKECAIIDLEKTLPLHDFITKELNNSIQVYKPNEYKLIIGHSFSASFALYSYLKSPTYYAAVFAHSPLDEMELLIKNFQQAKGIDLSKISLSVGGIGKDKDYHHRVKHEHLEESYPKFYEAINYFKADYSAHNSVPIAATPVFLTQLFADFSSRYYATPEVDQEYKLINPPSDLNEELKKVIESSKLDDYFYPPEIPDLNGIASKYWNNGYLDLASKVYELGVKYYPKFYDFYLSLYQLNVESDKDLAKKYILKARSLLMDFESDWEGKSDLLEEIELEISNHGW